MQRVRFVALVAGAALVASSVAAVADNVAADGDIVNPASTAVSFGEVCSGTDASRTIEVKLVRSGNGNVFANSASVAISGSAPAGVSVSSGTITTPATWDTGNQSVDNGKVAGPTPVVATLDTSALRTVAGSIQISATDGVLTRTVDIGVSGVVKACSNADTTPPSSASVIVNGGDAWTNDATVLVDVSATDDVGVVRYRLAESQVGLGAATDVLVSPAEASFGRQDLSLALTGTDAAAKEVWLRVYDAAGNSADAHDTIGLDRIAPTLTTSRTPAAGNLVGGVQYGWNNTDVTVSFDCDDELSGFEPTSCPADVMVSGNGADQSVEGTVTDRAGNTTTRSVGDIDIDKLAPEVQLVGGTVAGSYYPHQLVAASAPACIANDQVGLSGLVGPCTVTGASGFPAVGGYEFAATAQDRAGNTGLSAPRVVQVLGYRTSGFYSPVDMNGTLNLVKSGSTVPLKFEVFAGDVEMTDTAVVTGLKPVLTTCEGQSVDDVEVLASGGTSLRYDASGIGQFIYNWQTPRGKAGYCYRVAVQLLGGQTISADFKLK